SMIADWKVELPADYKIDGFATKEIENLCRAACKACDKAYVPRSHFPVGAALIPKDSKEIITGANVEYSPIIGNGLCAERSTVCQAIGRASGPFKGIRALAILCWNLPQPARPCGACRQSLVE